MKTTLFILLFTISVQAQNSISTRPVCIVFNQAQLPIRAYQEWIDCYGWMQKHNEGSYQDGVNLYYRYNNDTTLWRPTTMVIMDCARYPVMLTQKFLQPDTIYLIMMNSPQTAHIADRAYQHTADGQHYVDNFKLKYIKIPYFTRNKKSYDEIYRQKRRILNR